jgi:hypothetical protein
MSIITEKEFLETVIEETAVLAELYTGKCKPILFLPEYEEVYKGLNNGKDIPSLPGNPNKRWWIEYVGMRHLFKKIKKESNIPVLHDGFKIPNAKGNILITTSYPVDLLCNSRNCKLFLLESHTGVLKDELEWYTKYHKIGTKELMVFPFNQRVLYLLGDTHNMVAPEKINIRNELHRLAVECKWTIRTTDDKVVFDIKKSSMLSEVMKNYKKIY